MRQWQEKAVNGTVILSQQAGLAIIGTELKKLIASRLQNGHALHRQRDPRDDS